MKMSKNLWKSARTCLDRSKRTDMTNVVIIGSGGHAKVVADIIRSNGDRIAGFLDSIYPDGKIFDYTVLGPEDEYTKYEDCSFIVAVGDTAARERISKKLKNVKWYTAIHPSAIVSDLDVVIGEGSVVCANAVINPSAKIGKHCIINTGACVEHDCKIGDFSHVSVGTKLAGKVCVGERNWIGIGAAVREKISICNDCIVGAGAVVVKDLVESGTYIGVPAKKR